MAADTKGTVRQNPETLAVAVRNALSNPAIGWTITTLDNGSHYDDGTECAEWPEMTPGAERIM